MATTGPTPTNLLVVALLIVGPAVLAIPAPAAPSTATIVAVHPNPAAYGDAGEAIVVELAAPTDLTGWTIADGETVVRFPNRTLAGRVVATTDPAALPYVPANATVVGLSGRLALANTGETIELRNPAGLVDSVTYTDAPEGQQYVATPSGWEWRTPGATDRPVVTARDVPATLFVLPDSPGVALDAIESARERVLLAAYTFASPRVGAALCSAHARGVHVEVLLEGSPVGGVTTRQAGALDDLVECGVSVHVLGGPGDRYAVHHAKYAVVDGGRALVLTENWKPAGVGGRSSRGWGVLVESPTVAAALAETFRADADFRDARPWADVRQGTTLVEEPEANGSFPARFAPASVEVDRIDVLVTPDNAEGAIVDLVDGSTESVSVQQVSIGGPDGPFLGATLRAARRGVPTQVLLSGAWYVEDDNRALQGELDALARRERLPLQARLVTPRSRFRTTHVKGLVVDGETAVVGSLNWNAYAARRNREVLLALHDPEAAAYYGRVFTADWRGGTWRLPVGFGVTVVVASATAGAVLARRIEFVGPEAPGVDPAIPGPMAAAEGHQPSNPAREPGR